MPEQYNPSNTNEYVYSNGKWIKVKQSTLLPDVVTLVILGRLLAYFITIFITVSFLLVLCMLIMILSNKTGLV